MTTHAGSIKRTKLDYKTLYPNNYGKQNVGSVLNIFNEKTVTTLKQKQFYDTAVFLEKIHRLWSILNVKSLNDPDRLPFHVTNDERVNFLRKRATFLKEMDNSLRGQRKHGLREETANVWHIIMVLLYL